MEALIGSALQIAIIDIFVVLSAILRVVKVNALYLFLANAFFLCGSFLLVVGSILSDYLSVQWNWVGKSLSLLFSIIVILYIYKARPEIQLSELGVTWRQNRRSIALSVALLAVVSFLILFGKTLHFPDSVETLMFQGTMPGLDEELVFRGILLYLLSVGVVSKKARFIGADWNFSCLLVVVLFGLVHGLGYKDGVYFNLGLVIGTAVSGLLFLWCRLVSGSLVMPIIVHNASNTLIQFVDGA